MKIFAWDTQKNDFLKRERGISFEQIAFQIEQGDVLNIVDHPNAQSYGHQRVFIIQISDYIYAVPFVEDENAVFLKTAFPSRKLTKQYLRNSDDEP
jgi:uncharacterized DUF497 family protein